MADRCCRTYDIVLRQPMGNVLGTLKGEINFHVANKVNSTGTFVCDIFRDRCFINNQPFSNISSFLISPDAEDTRIEVWRSIGGVRTLVGESPYFLQLATSSQDKEGRRIIHLEADDSISLLERRINPYDAEKACAKLDPLPADDIIKKIATCNYGAAAASYFATPDPSRNLSAYMQIQANAGAAPVYEAKAENQGVLDMMGKAAKYSISQGTPLFFRPVQINNFGNPFLEFRTFIGQQGTDRTAAAGGVTLTPENEQIGSYEITFNWRDTASRMYAGGKGTGAAKTYQTVDDPTLASRLLINPFALHEKMHTVNTDEAPKILAEAFAELWYQYKAVASMTGNLGQIGLCRYGFDLFWGDKISTMADGLFFDVFLDTEEIQYESGREELTIGFSSELARKYKGVTTISQDIESLKRQFRYAANKDYN